MDTFERVQDPKNWHQGLQKISGIKMKQSLIVSSLLGLGFAYVYTPDGIIQFKEYLLGGSAAIGLVIFTGVAVLNLTSRLTEHSPVHEKNTI